MRSDGNFVETFFLAVFIAIAFVVRAAVFAGKMLIKGVLALCHFGVAGERWLQERKHSRQAQDNPAQAAMPVQDPVSTALEDTAEQPQSAQEDERLVPGHPGLRSIADCHVNVVFNDSFTASVALHSQESLVRRKMRAVSEAAGDLMRDTYGRETWDLPDYRLTGSLTLEDAIVDTEKVGTAFLTALLVKEKATALSPPAPANMSASQEAGAARALAILRSDESGTPESAPPTAAPPEEVVTTMRVRRPPGEITRGVVIECGHRALLWQGRAKRNGEQGTTFEAILEIEDGSTASFRGVRLQEQFAQHDVHIGDFIEVTSLGRTKVDIRGEKGNVEQGMRNEFQVKVLERAAQRV